MPVGGQTAVALGLTNASASPNLPASVYMAARRMQVSGNRPSIVTGVFQSWRWPTVPRDTWRPQEQRTEAILRQYMPRVYRLGILRSYT